MGRVRIVTDSTCDLHPALVRELNITLIPPKVRIGQEEFVPGVTLSDDDFYAHLRAQPHVHVGTVPPSVAEFEAVYARLAKTTDSILSVHLSSKLAQNWQNAVEAKERYSIRDLCRVVVIDTQLASLGLGYIALEAARAAQAGQSLDEVAKLARGMIPQTHVMFFVDSTDALQVSSRFIKIQNILSNVASIKPLMRLEEGQIVLMEKVRTRAKALERLYEFVIDFPRIQELGIVYSTTPNEANNLAKRLESIVPAGKVTIVRSGPGLVAHAGPGSLGVVVYEGLER
jgi:DegV family protein with EDD domain